MKMNKKAFTLTELLVTIVILGIITAMAVPLITLIKEANAKRKYNAFLESLTYSSKLYVDSYQEDLFQYQDSGCAYIDFSDLKEKLLTKDIEMDGISCDSEETFIKVIKVFDVYSYTPTMGCGKVESGKVNVSLNYPEKHEKTSTCGPDGSMRITFQPNESLTNTKKRVNVKVKVESETGYNTQSKISYGLYKIDGAHPQGNYLYVDQWQTLSFDIPSKEKQLEKIGNGVSFDIISDNITTPTGETGEYQIVLRIDSLADLAGVNWTSGENTGYVYSGLYKVDNTKPTINNIIATSTINAYRSLTPKISITTTDNNTYTSNEDLLACYSKDEDSCSKTVANIKKYKKLSEINNKTVEELSNSLDGSDHTLYITVADKAGNYETKSITYQVAQTYKINYDSNNGSVCSPKAKKVYYNKESVGSWGVLCSPTRDYYSFVGWNRKKDGTGETITKDTKVSNDELEITVYAQWKPVDYDITYDLDGGTVSPANPTKYNVESPDITLNNPTRTGYDFTGWTGTDLSSATKVVKIPKGSHGARSYKANWSVHDYSISYTLNNGTVSTANPESYNINTPTFTLNNPQRRGYTFAGWTGTNLSSATKNVSVTTGSTGDRAYEATFNLNYYDCDAGYYLAKDAISCSKCTANHYCPGGRYPYNETEDQGINNCPDGYSNGKGNSIKSSCVISCAENKRVNSVDAKCNTNCPSGYHHDAHTVASGSTSTACEASDEIHEESGTVCSPNGSQTLTFTTNDYIEDSLSYEIDGGTISCSHNEGTITCSVTINNTKKKKATSHDECKCAFQTVCTNLYNAGVAEGDGFKKGIGRACGAMYNSGQCWLGDADSPVWDPTNSSAQSAHSTWCAKSFDNPKSPGYDHHCPRTSSNGHHYCSSSSNNCKTGPQYIRSTHVSACLCMAPKGEKYIWSTSYQVSWRTKAS